MPDCIASLLINIGMKKSRMVKVRRNCLTGSGKSNMCHHNVTSLVSVYRGHRVVGFIPTPEVRNNTRGWTFHGHSVWLTPEGKMVDVTAHNFTSEDQQWFIPFLIDDAYSTFIKNLFVRDDAKTCITYYPHIDPEEYDETHHLCRNLSWKDLFEFSDIETELDIIDIIKQTEFNTPSKHSGLHWKDIFEKQGIRYKSTLLQRVNNT